MEDFVGLAIPVIFVLGLVFERIWAAEKQPKVRFWLLKGIIFFAITGAVNAVLPSVLAHFIAGRAPIHLASLGTIGGAVLGFVVSDLVNYWLHRAMHRFHFVWRWSHQMHHSAERMDLAGMAYAHPFELLLAVGMTSLVTILLGFSAEAAALGGFIGFLYAVFQHMNVKTPQWIGYLVMRPEAHKVHHTRGVHAYNYGNLPLWDIVFGTFRNPREVNAEYGFYAGASKRMGAMLIGRDIEA